MRIVVFGSNGGVGRLAVTAGVARGHEIVAAARTVPSTLSRPGVTPIALDVRDADGLRRVVDGADALLWCVGVTRRSGGDVGRTAMPLLVAAAQQCGVARLVSVSGAGVTLPGDRKGVGARLISGLTRRLARDLVMDKEGEHAALAASQLSWTEVRPPRLRDSEGSGRWQLSDVAPGLTAKPLAKADVAAAMLDLAQSREWIRRSPFLLAA